ncbi:MAG TPA: acyltransferase [Rubricoccaceae bacterium]
MSKGVDPTVQQHSHALIEDGATVGARTRIWAWAHVLPGAIIGADCNICDHTYIETGVVLGDRVTVKCGVFLWDGVMAEDDVFIGPAAVFTNDLVPRSGQHPLKWAKTTLSQGCSIGANATILANRCIGKFAMVGAGAVVTRDVPDYGLVIGNPARLVGWVAIDGTRLDFPVSGAVEYDGLEYVLSDGRVSTGPPRADG